MAANRTNWTKGKIISAAQLLFEMKASTSEENVGSAIADFPAVFFHICHGTQLTNTNIK